MSGFVSCLLFFLPNRNKPVYKLKLIYLCTFPSHLLLAYPFRNPLRKKGGDLWRSLFSWIGENLNIGDISPGSARSLTLLVGYLAPCDTLGGLHSPVHLRSKAPCGNVECSDCGVVAHTNTFCPCVALFAAELSFILIINQFLAECMCALTNSHKLKNIAYRLSVSWHFARTQTNIFVFAFVWSLRLSLGREKHPLWFCFSRTQPQCV